jgi:hypothetical protein
MLNDEDKEWEEFEKWKDQETRRKQKAEEESLNVSANMPANADDLPKASPAETKWDWEATRGWLVLIVILCVVYWACCTGKRTSKITSKTTVAEAEEIIKADTNEMLKDKNSDLSEGVREFVEKAHVTVEVKASYATDVIIETRDGGDYTVNRDGSSNIRRLSIIIASDWDGVVHKDGRTVFALETDGQNVLNVRILQTDAAVNIMDPKWWFKAGSALGAILVF